MSEMNCQECQLWLHGYLDNELDTGEALKLHKHLLACDGCRNRYRQMQRMMHLVREKAAYHDAPAGLSAKIASAIGAQAKAAKSKAASGWMDSFRNWWQAPLVPAASLVALAFSVLFYVSAPSPYDRLTDEAVSDHVRSLMAQHLTDVASSDRHTVKPWFIGKIDFAPPVFDFASDGFPLIGGRMDYLQSQTVVALAYQHNKHFINLFIAPTPQGDSSGSKTLVKRGYNLVTWEKGHMSFVAVSDMGMEDLKNFSKLFQENMSK